MVGRDTLPKHANGVPEVAGDLFAIFESAELKVILPFLTHNAPAPAMKMFTPYLRHLLFMVNELVILTAPAAPGSVELSSQLREAKVGWAQGSRDVWASIPFEEIDEIRLRGATHRAIIPRLIVNSHHWKVPRHEVDYWNNLTFVFGSRGSGRAYDEGKITLARELLPTVLPARIHLKGF